MRREKLVAFEQATFLLLGGDAVVTTSSSARPAAPAATLEPALLDLVLRHDELSLGAKTVVIYVLTQPHTQVIGRAELARLGGAATSHHLDGLLHELVAAHWLMPVPGEDQPCCADGFLLREDADQDDAPPRVTRPGGGAAW